MIKKFLLAGSVLSLAVAANAQEKEVYIIKDGKMVNCEFVPSSDPVEEAYEIEESTNAAGENMVKVKNPETNYKAGLLYLPQGVDLNETWNLELEYFFEEGMELTAGCTKHESWRFDLMADTMPVAGSSWKTNANQVEYRIAHVSIDARMRDFYECIDGVGTLNNRGVGKLRTVSKYVYSTPFWPKGVAERGDGNQVKAIFFAMFPEASAELVGYIKNLKFTSKGTKPFYADRMTIPAGEGTIHSQTFTSYVYATNAGDETVGELSYEDDELESPNKMYGQQLFISQCTNGYYNAVKGDRMYCDEGEQGVADFYDVEYGFLPFMTAYHIDSNKPKNNIRADKTGIIADAQIRIPLGDAVKEKVSIAMRLGHNAGQSGSLTPYEEYAENSGDIRFPVEYRFESGDAQTISSKTEWKQFRPTFTEGGDDYVDSIPRLMQMVYGDVELPSAEYDYITLRLMPNDVISIMWGDIRLTGDQNKWPKGIEDYTLGSDYRGNKIPVGFKSGVNDVVAKGEISIYPNPASDVITVANAGVKSVSVYSIAGTLVASSESNTVNIANLANGIYVVKANTEAGVITGQIIKK